MHKLKIKNYGNLISISAMIVITILTQIISLSKASVIASIFGTSIEMDAYNLALSIITFVFGFFSAGVTTIIIPCYINDKSRKRVDAFITFIFLVICIISSILIFKRNDIINVISQKNNVFINLTGRILVILIIGQFFSAFSNIIAAYFQCINKYNIPKVIAFFVQIVVLLVILEMKKFSIYLYAIVVSSSLIVEFLINVVIAFLNDWRYLPNFRFKSERFQPLLKMFIPTIFSTGIYQLSLLVDSLIASRLEVGKISILSYSNQIVNIINVAIIGNLLIYSYPKIVKKIKTNESQTYFWKNVSFFHMIVCLLICGFINIGYEGVSLLFQHGEFDESATFGVFVGSLIYIFGQQTDVIRDLIYRYFYAKGNTKDPAINGLVISVTNIIISLILVRCIGFYGIIIGTVIASFISVLIILYKFIKKIKLEVKISKVTILLVKNIIISVITTVIVYATKRVSKINNNLLSIILFGMETVIIFIILVLIISKEMFLFAKEI